MSCWLGGGGEGEGVGGGGKGMGGGGTGMGGEREGGGGGGEERGGGGGGWARGFHHGIHILLILGGGIVVEIWLFVDGCVMRGGFVNQATKRGEEKLFNFRHYLFYQPAVRL